MEKSIGDAVRQGNGRMEHFGFQKILEENVSKQMETPFHHNFSFQTLVQPKNGKWEISFPLSMHSLMFKIYKWLKG